MPLIELHDQHKTLLGIQHMPVKVCFLYSWPMAGRHLNFRSLIISSALLSELEEWGRGGNGKRERDGSPARFVLLWLKLPVSASM